MTVVTGSYSLAPATLIVCINMSACGPMGGEEKIGNSWPIDAAVEYWGIPADSMRLSSGNTIYQWGITTPAASCLGSPTETFPLWATPQAFTW
jgi:hypothetical protein